MQSFPFLMFDELGVRLGVKLGYCGVQLKFRPLPQTQELDPLGWEQLPPNSCTHGISGIIHNRQILWQNLGTTRMLVLGFMDMAILWG